MNLKTAPFLATAEVNLQSQIYQRQCSNKTFSIKLSVQRGSFLYGGFVGFVYSHACWANPDIDCSLPLWLLSIWTVLFLDSDSPASWGFESDWAPETLEAGFPSILHDHRTALTPLKNLSVKQDLPTDIQVYLSIVHACGLRLYRIWWSWVVSSIGGYMGLLVVCLLQMCSNLNNTFTDSDSYIWRLLW